MNGKHFRLFTARRTVLRAGTLTLPWAVACIVVALLLGANPALRAYAAPGDLDTTFGGDGKVTTDFFSVDVAYSVAIQSDDRIVAGGFTEVIANGDQDFALSRYNPDGTLDINFDLDGKVTTNFLDSFDRLNDLAIQPNGRIVAAGYANVGNIFYDFALTRYLPNGSLDSSFSGNGKLVTEFGSDDRAYAVAIQSDGKIVAAGETSGDDPDFAVARYNTDGSLDTTFSGDGMVTTDFGTNDYARDVAIRSDGKIMVAGFSGHALLNDDFAVARYNPNGSLDTTFSSDGMVTTDFFGDDDRAAALLLQPDDKIVVGGSALSPDSDFALVRYTSDGNLDTTFSGNGKVITGFGGDEDVRDLALQANGKIVAGGFVQDGFGSDFGLTRYNPNGSLDMTFSGDGKVITGFLDSSSAYALALQANGQILAAGGAGEDFALARYDGDPPATPTPTITPTRTATRTATRTNTAVPATSTATASSTPACSLNANYLLTTATGATQVPATNYIPGSTCNACTVAITLPFTYSLYDTPYTSVIASNKGNLQFTTSASTGVNACIPAAALGDSIVAYWDDINTNINDSMGIFTSVSGVAPNRIFNIRWVGGFVANDARVDFEVRLYEGQPRFEIIYAQTRGGFSATVGVQKGDGTRFTQHSCNANGSVPFGTILTFDRTQCTGMMGSKP